MRSPLLALVLALAPLPLFADPASDQLIEDGLKLREQGKDAEALSLFEKAHASSPSPRALAQIALAEQALGRFVLAEQHLAQALATKDAWIDSRRPALAAALTAVGKRLARVTVSVATDGAKIRVNGRDAANKQPVGALPGKVKIDVSAPGYLPFSKTVELAAEAKHAETVTLAKAAAPVAAKPEPAPTPKAEPAPTLEAKPEPAPAVETKAQPALPPPTPEPKPAPAAAPAPSATTSGEPASGGNGLVTAGWITGAAAVGLITIGAILLATDSPPEACFNDILEACSSGGQTAGTALLITGAVAAGGAATLLVVGYSDDGRPSASLALSPRGALATVRF